MKGTKKTAPHPRRETERERREEGGGGVSLEAAHLYQHRFARLRCNTPVPAQVWPIGTMETGVHEKLSPKVERGHRTVAVTVNICM